VVMVGTPTVGEIIVSATVVDHVKGPKVVSFKYRPKKRIRVKGGHRHFYTRLMIDFIGKSGEERKVEVKSEPVVVAEVDAERADAAEEPKVVKQKKASTKDAAKKPAATKSASKSSTTQKTEKK
jgi:ribosomal protein L21